MMTCSINGGASAPPNVLPFPQTARALSHHESGMAAAGVCSLIYYRQEPPPNVELFDSHRHAPDMERSPELALFLALYSTLNDGQRNDAKQALKRLCRDGDGPSARTALDFLQWGERPSLPDMRDARHGD